MHKTWPSPKFPNCCVCDLGWCSAPRLGSASISLAPCSSCSVVGFPWGAEVGLAGEEKEKDFVLCFVSGGSGITFLRVPARWGSSRVWVFPAGSRAESWGGCRAESSAGALGASQSWRKWWEGMSCIQMWGFLCISLGCPPKILSGDQMCTRSLWSVSRAACGWGASVQGVWGSWDVVILEQTRVLNKNNHGNEHFALPCFPPWLSVQGGAKFWLQQMGPLVRGAGEGAKMWLRVSPAGIESINLSGLFFPLFRMLLMGMEVGASFLFIFLTVFRC